MTAAASTPPNKLIQSAAFPSKKRRYLRLMPSRVALAAALLLPSLAFAETPPVASPCPPPALPAAPSDPEPPPQRFFLALDTVVGSGRWKVFDLGSQGTGTLDQAPATVLSLLPSVAYKLTPQLSLAARVPLSIAWFSPEGFDSRAVFALGNVELGASLTLPLTPETPIVLGLDIDLPTAQGSELPEPADLPTLRPTASSRSDFDRYSANATASAARGWESLGLFEPSTITLSPRAFVPWRPIERVFVGPWVKFENLIATSGNVGHYAADLVVGVRMDYLVLERLDIGARLWINAPLTGVDWTAVTTVVEPEMRVHVGAFSAIGSVLVPLSGPSSITDPRFVGARLALLTRF